MRESRGAGCDELSDDMIRGSGCVLMGIRGSGSTDRSGEEISGSGCVLMGIKGSGCVLMDINGSGCVAMGIKGSGWSPAVIKGSGCAATDVNDSDRTALDEPSSLCASPRFSVSSLESEFESPRGVCTRFAELSTEDDKGRFAVF